MQRNNRQDWSMRVFIHTFIAQLAQGKLSRSEAHQKLFDRGVPFPVQGRVMNHCEKTYGIH